MSDVRTERSGSALHVVLDRPPLNVLTTGMLQGIASALHDVGDARSVVLRGAGKGFSAGADVRDHLPGAVEGMLAAFRAAVMSVRGCPAPVIAQVHGPCLGGGMELAMAADLVYAADTATFGQPEIKLGVFPPVAAALYPAWFGKARAAEVVLLGETVRAEAALVRGFVTAVVPEARLADEVASVCARIALLSPSSLRIAREALRAGGALESAALEATEDLYLHRLMRTEDATEGLQAFLEKRAAKWRGR